MHIHLLNDHLLFKCRAKETATIIDWYGTCLYKFHVNQRRGVAHYKIIKFQSRWLDLEILKLSGSHLTNTDKCQSQYGKVITSTIKLGMKILMKVLINSKFHVACIEVWEQISYLIPHFTGHVITDLCWIKGNLCF